MTDKDDAFLEDMFATARTVDASVPKDLVDRVVADAALVPRKPVVMQSIWTSLVDAIGGWPALGGVAVAGVTGLWLGVAPPASVETIAADFLGNTTTVSFMTGVDDFVEGGLIDG